MITKRKIAAFIALGSIVSIGSTGCVSRGAYNENVATLLAKLNQQKIESNEQIKALEQKVQDRGRTLGDLTNRYMELKRQNEFATAKLNNLQTDLEALLRDMAELKLVVFTNFKGSEANEMMLKITDMQKRVQELLRRGEETLPPAAPAANGPEDAKPATP